MMSEDEASAHGTIENPCFLFSRGNIDSDDDSITEQGVSQKDLAWRRDPEESFSDWTIRVIPKEENETDTDSTATTSSPSPTPSNSSLQSRDFPVHRVYLASGPRKSDYFKTLFSTEAATMEREEHRTELTLPNTACMAMEQFLDFVYGGRVFLTMNTDTVVALHYLADYLQVPPLQKITSKLIRCGMDGGNVDIYCREALKYGVEWVIEECIKVAARSPQMLLQEEKEAEVVVSPSVASLSSVSSCLSAATLVATEQAAQHVMAMLPPVKQVQLLQLALSRSLDELKLFKRVPSGWKENIMDVRATHLPTLVNSTMHYPLQGSGLEFQGRVCPLFYFDLPQSSRKVLELNLSKAGKDGKERTKRYLRSLPGGPDDQEE
jgi:BTB/POZ domain